MMKDTNNTTKTLWERVIMTNPEILKLAKTCEFHYHKIWRHKGGKSDNQIHWECWEDQLLKFALLIHEDGYNKGYDDSKSSSFKGFHTCLDD
jgi:hypothetical protein